MAVPSEDVFSKTMNARQRKAAARRGAELIAEHRSLQQLRRARELTQVQLAQLLGKDQVSISQLEKRSDMLLSTLRSYVEAMGGSLRLVVQFKGEEPLDLHGLGDHVLVSSRRNKRGNGEAAPLDHATST